MRRSVRVPTVRVLIAGDDVSAGPAAKALEGEGFDVLRAEDAEPGEAGDGELSPLAARLLELESRLEASPVEAAVVTDASDDSLAAVLVATKVPVPVGFAGEGAEASVNGRVISHLADERLAPEPAAAVAWLQGLVPS